MSKPVVNPSSHVASSAANGDSVPGRDGDVTRWERLRPLVLRLHFYGGILAGPFILIAAVTGLLYTLTPQLDSIVYSHELTVDTVGSQHVSYAQQVRAAQQYRPSDTVISIRPPSRPHETTWVQMSDPDVAQGYQRTIFVDPYSGTVRGDAVTFGQWLPIRAWFDELHRNLHLGAFGRNYSEVAASWMWIVSLGGLALWVSHRRRRRGALGVIQIVGKRGSRQRHMSWHGVLGVVIIVGLLGLSVTGLTWSRYAGKSVGELKSALSWTTPTVTTTGGPPVMHHHGDTEPAVGTSANQAVRGIDTVAATATAAGMRAPMWFTAPTAVGQAWKVAEKKRRAPTHYDAIAVDPATGSIVDSVSFASWPLAAKLTNWTIDAHMGILFGVANQIALALLMFGLIAVIVRGYIMWWHRRPTRRMGLPRAPARGALGQLQPVEAVVAVCILAVVGYCAPWLGGTLAAFVGLDVAWGIVRARREDLP